MFDMADNPDQHYAAGGDGAVGVATDEVPDVGDLVRYAYAAGDEEDGAVGVEDREAAVGTFD